MLTIAVQTSINHREVHIPILTAVMSTGNVFSLLLCFVNVYREQCWCMLRVYDQTCNTDIIKSFSPCLSTKKVLLEVSSIK